MNRMNEWSGWIAMWCDDRWPPAAHSQSQVLVFPDFFAKKILAICHSSFPSSPSLINGDNQQIDSPRFSLSPPQKSDKMWLLVLVDCSLHKLPISKKPTFGLKIFSWLFFRGKFFLFWLFLQSHWNYSGHFSTPEQESPYNNFLIPKFYTVIPEDPRIPLNQIQK